MTGQPYLKPPGRERRFVYRRPVRLLHWLVVAIVTAAVALGIAHNLVESSQRANELLAWHRSVGMLILFTVVVRIAIRLRFGPRPYTGVSPQIEKVSAAGHAALYLILVAIPLSGWVLSDASHHDVSLLGFALPHWIARNRDLADSLPEWHAGAVIVGGCLVGVHVFAALYHHHVLRDGVLHSMLPLRTLRKPWVEAQSATGIEAESPAVASHRTIDIPVIRSPANLP